MLIFLKQKEYSKLENFLESFVQGDAYLLDQMGEDYLEESDLKEQCRLINKLRELEFDASNFDQGDNFSGALKACN